MNSVIGIVFISAGVHNVLLHDGLDVVKQNKQVHAEQADGHAGGDPADGHAPKRLAEGDGGEDEAGVGEDHGPPTEVEVLGRRADHGDGGDAEPPQAKAPEGSAQHVGHYLHDGLLAHARRLGGYDAAEAYVKVCGDVVGHAYHGQGSEGGRADAHEQAGAVLPVRQVTGHQSTDHVRVHHHADQHAQALADEPSHDYGDGRDGGLGARDDGGDGSRQHDGEDGQDPSGHHGLQAMGLGTKDIAVLSNGQHQGSDQVAPKHGLDEPVEGHVVVWDGISMRACDEGGNAQEKGRKEETLAAVLQRSAEVARVEKEAYDHGAEDTGKYNEVDDVYGQANGPEAGELVRLGVDEQRQTAGAHGKGEPGPGEVMHPLFPAQLRPRLVTVGVPIVMMIMVPSVLCHALTAVDVPVHQLLNVCVLVALHVAVALAAPANR